MTSTTSNSGRIKIIVVLAVVSAISYLLLKLFVTTEQPMKLIPRTNTSTAKSAVVANAEQKYVFLGTNRTVGYIWPRSDDEDSDRIENQVRYLDEYRPIKSNRRVKTILRVGEFNWDNWVGGRTLFKDCPISECSLAYNISPAASADVLLMSEFGPDYRRRYLPKPAHQIWIAQHWESPMHDRIDAASLRGLVNWTVSYRRDSTIAISYGKYRRRNGTSSATTTTAAAAPINYAEGKTKMVAWFVSNCAARNSRRDYARRLGFYVKVDVFGACGTKLCQQNREPSCSNLLKTDYKFYLAFENSNCKDYITEKLWQTALQ